MMSGPLGACEDGLVSARPLARLARWATRRAPARWASPGRPAWRAAGRALALAGGLALAGLAGCGGGGGPEAAPVSPLPPSVRGESTDALSPAPTQVEVTAKGSSGLSRTSASLLSGTRFEVSLQELSGPYLLASARTDGAFVFALALQEGTANLTPLTTLVVTQWLGQDPLAFFEALGHNGGVPAVTAAELDLAQRQVEYHLHRRLGLDWRGSASFTTTPFVAAAGDAHFERLRLLQATLAGQGRTLSALVDEIRLQTQRCTGPRLTVQGAVESRLFCPQTSSTSLDPTDGSVRLHEFSDLFGDHLQVRLRGDDVVSARFTFEGVSHDCSGAGCAGLRPGAFDSAGERPLQLDTLALQAADGQRLQLSGVLTAAALGQVFPPLACEDNLAFLIPPSGEILGFCDGDVIGRASGRARQVHTLADEAGVVASRIDVTVQGETLISVSLWQLDGDTERVTHRCLGTACTGVTVSAVAADGLRRVTLQDTPLAAVDASGAPSGEPLRWLRAQYRVEDESYEYGTYCGFDNGEVRGVFSDETEGLRVCVPTAAFSDETGFYDLVGRTSGEGGELGYYVVSMEGRFRRGNFNGGIADRLVVQTLGGQVLSVQFFRRDGQRFGCEAAACTGVTVTPGDGSQASRIRFADTLLVELTRGNLAGDRSLRLSRGFDVPP
jgi:hypothetical protein